MELRHLRYFVAIAEEGSFSRAAERLWVAQPGLSTQIRRLERELDIQLFERHTRGVDLTEAGELFLERARAALVATDAAFAVGHDLAAGIVGSVRVGIATETAWHLVPELLDTFSREWPKIELTVYETYAGTLLRDLQDGRLDVVIAPSVGGSAELRSLRLGREPWFVLAAPPHRLAAADGAVTARELHDEQLVVTGHRDGAAYDRAVLETLSELGVTPVIRRGGSRPALFAGVASGEAVALTTSPAAVARDVVVRPLHPTRRLEFALLWRDATPAPAVEHFIDAAKTTAEPARPVLRAVA